MNLINWIKKGWELVNNISSETRSLIIIFLFGYILYSQLAECTKNQISKRFQEEVLHNKEAEQYSRETAIEINYQIQMIAKRDTQAFNVLLLNYHNNTQSLQGYKYLYLSCLTEAPKSLDTPLLKQQWNKIDFIYYADELSKIHNQNFVYIDNIEKMSVNFPKLYRLVKASDAKALSFYTIEGRTSAIGMVVILYKEPKTFNPAQYYILPYIQKLALLLDYENLNK